MLRKIYLLTLFIGGAIIAGLAPAWWVVIIPCFLIGLLWKIDQREAFFLSFVGVAIVHIVIASVIDMRNHSILSSRISELFQGIGIIPLILISALPGGLLGGASAALGAAWRPILKNTTKNENG